MNHSKHTIKQWKDAWEPLNALHNAYITINTITICGQVHSMLSLFKVGVQKKVKKTPRLL
jgi:hypothetical protein